MHRATYSEICEWILNSWDRILDNKKGISKIWNNWYGTKYGDGVPTSSNVVCDDSHSADELDSSTNSDTEEHLSPELLQLYNEHCDTESKDFDGFSDIEN